MALKIRMLGATDVGLVRKMNQDSFHFDPKKGIAIICDGIGGRKGGEVASSIAVRTVLEEFTKGEVQKGEAKPEQFFAKAADKANRQILERGMKETEIKGMGTTMISMIVSKDRAYFGHVGDSRAYLYQQGQMWQLTVDHNIETFISRGWMKQEMIAPGTSQEALVRSVGLTDSCPVDVYNIRLKPGQIFLSCSDGLSGMSTDRRIARIIQYYERDLTKAPAALIDEAKRGGGKDNVTLILTQIVEV